MTKLTAAQRKESAQAREDSAAGRVLKGFARYGAEDVRIYGAKGKYAYIEYGPRNAPNGHWVAVDVLKEIRYV